MCVSIIVPSLANLGHLLMILFSVYCMTENALAHQACVLQSDLEKALEDNASLFFKIGRSYVFLCFVGEFLFS